MRRIRALGTIIFVVAAFATGRVLSAQTVSVFFSSALLPGAETDDAYRVPAIAELGADWWLPVLRRTVALSASVTAAGFIPDDEQFGRSTLIAPTGGVRVRVPIRDTGVHLSAESGAGIYTRYSRIDGETRVARRPYYRATGLVTFLDAYGWEAGVRAGYVVFDDDSRVGALLVGIIVGRVWD
jgi:hypothetical protein